MDKNGRIFGKINIIDLSAVLVVILAIIGISVRFTSIAAENVKEKTQFSYVIEIDDIRFFSVAALQKMGLATDKQGNIIGEITDVKYDKKIVQTVLENGETVKSAVPERYTVRINLEAEGKETDSGYFVGENTELSVGSSITMYTKYANCSGKIVEVNKIENQGE